MTLRYPNLREYSGSLLFLILTSIPFFLVACSSEKEVRMPDDIVGVWSSDSSHYMDFTDNYTIWNLEIMEEEGEQYGLLTQDAYYYEPGYNLVIYMGSEQKVIVYEVTDLNDKKLTWCPVKEIEIEDAQNADNVGQILGDIIKEAQQGFKLDPALFESFNKVSYSHFKEILESLGLDDLW